METPNGSVTETGEMRPRQTPALCAVALALTVATSAIAQAQEAGQPAVRAAGSTAAAPKRAAHRKAAPASAKAAASKGSAAPVAGSYELVPTNPTGSALARARQNNFATPDDDPATSTGSRRIGVGLGGGNGTTPGVTLGF